MEVDFPFRTTHYGIGISHGEGAGKCRLGSVEYELTEGSLSTMGPGIITCWDRSYHLKNETVFFTEGLFKIIKTHPLHTLPFFMHGGNHMIKVSCNELIKLKDLFLNIKKFSENMEVCKVWSFPPSNW